MLSKTEKTCALKNIWEERKEEKQGPEMVSVTQAGFHTTFVNNEWHVLQHFTKALFLNKSPCIVHLFYCIIGKKEKEQWLEILSL